MPPPLPEVVRLGTGPADGHYARFARALRAHHRLLVDRLERLEESARGA